MKEMLPVLKAKGSKPDVMTKVVSSLPPSVVGFLLNNVIFSPKSMPYALVAHNHYKVGYAVQEVITDAKVRNKGTTALRSRKPNYRTVSRAKKKGQ